MSILSQRLGREVAVGMRVAVGKLPWFFVIWVIPQYPANTRSRSLMRTDTFTSHISPKFPVHSHPPECYAPRFTGRTTG
jgi:hypothetical protein